MTTVIKLGGSLITDKSERASVDRDALERVCRILGRAVLDDIVLVHGGGSFGHHAADRHGISVDRGTHDPTATRDVMQAMDRLNDAVIDGLLDEQVAAVGLPPRGLATKQSDGELDMAVRPIATLLEESFLPVLHGDLVPTPGKGMTVLSGDTIAVELTMALGGDRVGLCTGVPGVLDASGEVVPEIRSYEQVASVLDEPAGVDVTGGMSAKVRSLLAIDTPGLIFGREDLPAFLDGKSPGTVVQAGDTAADTVPF